MHRTHNFPSSTRWKTATVHAAGSRFEKIKTVNKMGLRIIILIAACTLPWAQCQFPKACVNLESVRKKECCPVPNGFNAPCGSDGGRGECEDLVVRQWTKSLYSHYKDFQLNDDRHNWPMGLYNRTCKCRNNYAGYDCGKCEYGYYGNKCTQKKVLTRKHFTKLSDDEQDRYMRYINLTRHVLSDFMVTNFSYWTIQNEAYAGRDPKDLFMSVTNYDFFVWMHFYAARDTIHPDGHTHSDIDFAHDGQGFPTWHRHYMLEWERSIQEINHDENFTVPFWDWTEHQDESKIFTYNLLGVTDQSGDKDEANVKGKYFNDWYIICTRKQTKDLHEICDPTNKESGLKRLKSMGTLPTKDEVNFALRFETFDVPPYSKESSCNFRNLVEGYVSTKIGYRLPNAHTLHNQVHIAIGGTMGDVPSASNDPIFPLHHAFVDRIYEKWLRKYKKEASGSLSSYDAPIGHNKDGVIVPLLPVYTHEEMFKKSVEFGYEYEDVDEEGKSPDDEEIQTPISLGQCPVPCPVVSEAMRSTTASRWYLVISMIAGALLVASFLVKDS